MSLASSRRKTFVNRIHEAPQLGWVPVCAGARSQAVTLHFTNKATEMVKTPQDQRAKNQDRTYLQTYSKSKAFPLPCCLDFFVYFFIFIFLYLLISQTKRSLEDNVFYASRTKHHFSSISYGRPSGKFIIKDLIYPLEY